MGNQGISPQGFVHAFKPKRRFVTMSAIESILDKEYEEDGGFKDDQEGAVEDDEEEEETALEEKILGHMSEMQKQMDSNFKQALVAVEDKVESRIIGLDTKI